MLTAAPNSRYDGLAPVVCGHAGGPSWWWLAGPAERDRGQERARQQSPGGAGRGRGAGPDTGGEEGGRLVKAH